MMALFDKFKRGKKSSNESELEFNHSTEPQPEEEATYKRAEDLQTQEDKSLLGILKRGKKGHREEADIDNSADTDQTGEELIGGVAPSEIEGEESGKSLFDKFKWGKKEKPNTEENIIPSQEIPADNNTALESEAETESSDKATTPEPEGSPPSKVGIFEKFKIGLSKTRHNIGDKIENLVKSSRKLDEEFFEELEDILIQADVGMITSLELVDKIRKAAAKQKIKDPEEVTELIKSEISEILGSQSQPLNIAGGNPAIILVVGVNGAGKTTSIAKLAYRLKNENLQVMLAAGDTFRAAAIDQLQIWADRVGVELIKHQEGSDPGAVVYDAMNAARARKADVLIIDTAGRLQNKTNLMKEIGKVRKIIEREIPAAPHEVLLVVDATTGQNAISQAKVFREATGVSGIILTKLDGTAKGGIVIAVAKELDIPVKMVGIGEGLDDLRDFSPEAFADAIFNK